MLVGRWLRTGACQKQTLVGENVLSFMGVQPV